MYLRKRKFKPQTFKKTKTKKTLKPTNKKENTMRFKATIRS
jgi:hypothetical protein